MQVLLTYYNGSIVFVSALLPHLLWAVDDWRISSGSRGTSCLRSAWLYAITSVELAHSLAQFATLIWAQCGSHQWFSFFLNSKNIDFHWERKAKATYLGSSCAQGLGGISVLLSFLLIFPPVAAILLWSYGSFLLLFFPPLSSTSASVPWWPFWNICDLSVTFACLVPIILVMNNLVKHLSCADFSRDF